MVSCNCIGEKWGFDREKKEMRLIFEAVDEINIDDDFSYSIEIESIVFNMDNLDESLVEEAFSELSKKIINQMESNSKYIKDALEIEDFSVEETEIKPPVLLMKFTCNKLLDDNSLSSVLGRYTNVQSEETFNVDGKTSVIKIKPVRGELEIHFLA